MGVFKRKKKEKSVSDLLPRTLYVTVDDVGDGELVHIAEPTISAIPNGVTVGVYELMDVRTQRVTTELI